MYRFPVTYTVVHTRPDFFFMSDTPSFRPLLTTDDWAEARDRSSEGPVLIFKHSNACPSSARANREMRSLVEDGDLPVYRVVVQKSRAVSDAIADETGIRHETPQVLLLEGGSAVFDASHYRVKAQRIREQLSSV